VSLAAFIQDPIVGISADSFRGRVIRGHPGTDRSSSGQSTEFAPEGVIGRVLGLALDRPEKINSLRPFTIRRG
jgi:hypothetical protein